LETDTAGLGGRKTIPVGGFAEEDFRGSEIPGDAQKVEGPTFCKARRNCVKALIIKSFLGFLHKRMGGCQGGSGYFGKLREIAEISV
jgi:hypothetical protein